MITVKILDTGKLARVTPNVAHGLVEAGEAEIVSNNKWYETREMRTSPTKSPTKKESKKTKKSSKKGSKKRSASKTYKSK